MDLPTADGVIIRPPDACTAACWYNTCIAQERAREYGCCPESTPSGVALIATPKGPLASDPSCTAITVPKTRATTAIAKGGGVVGGRDVERAVFPGLAF